MTTKEQERKALEQIKKIVADLGQDSYIGTAFEGCFEIAEENIENDFACSMKQRADRAEKQAYERFDEIRELKAKLSDAEIKIEKLAERLDEELEWHDCEGGTNMEQADYKKLADNRSTKQLTDDEAKELIYEEFGFAKEKITILKNAKTYEANRHHQMRTKQVFSRPPIYDATDWNYIRFDCARWSYEMINGELRDYCH